MDKQAHFESALDWNRRCPPGTRVVLQLADGRTIATATAGWAAQWGTFAVLRLQQVDGLWTTSALVVAPDLFDGAILESVAEDLIAQPQAPQHSDASAVTCSQAIT